MRRLRSPHGGASGGVRALQGEVYSPITSRNKATAGSPGTVDNKASRSFSGAVATKQISIVPRSTSYELSRWDDTRSLPSALITTIFYRRLERAANPNNPIYSHLLCANAYKSPSQSISRPPAAISSTVQPASTASQAKTSRAISGHKHPWRAYNSASSLLERRTTPIEKNVAE